MKPIYGISRKDAKISQDAKMLRVHLSWHCERSEAISRGDAAAQQS